jgi:hypothetical protein
MIALGSLLLASAAAYGLVGDYPDPPYTPVTQDDPGEWNSGNTCFSSAGGIVCAAVFSAAAKDYYVDDAAGRDGNDGTSQAAAWKSLAHVNRADVGAAEFARYQKETGMDGDSAYGEPRFVNEACRDYRLVPGSFGSDLASDGGPVGARDMPGLDADQSLPEKSR